MRNFSRSSAAATSSAAANQLARRADVGELDVHRDLVVEKSLRPGGVDRRHHPAGVAGQVVEVAQGDLEPGHAWPATCAASRSAPAIAPAPPVTTTESGSGASDLRHLDVGDDERADQVGVPLLAAARRRRHGVVQRAVARGEDRGIVDQAALGCGGRRWWPPGHANDAGQTSAARPRLASWSAMISRCTSLAPSQIRSTRSSR